MRTEQFSSPLGGMEAKLNATEGFVLGALPWGALGAFLAVLVLGGIDFN